MILNNKKQVKIKNKKFIPALRYDKLTPLYDKVISWTMPERKFRSKLIKYLNPQQDEKILEFGFGSGQNIINALQFEDKAQYTGLDIDPKIKTIARKKLQQLNLLKFVRLDLYNGNGFPYPDNSFDKIFSCLVFHQLTTADKKSALAEILRVLRPNGTLLICDWGKPLNILSSLGFYLVQLLDGFKSTMDNRKGKIPEYLKIAGFKKVQQFDMVNTKLGTLRYTNSIK